LKKKERKEFRRLGPSVDPLLRPEKEKMLKRKKILKKKGKGRSRQP